MLIDAACRQHLSVCIFDFKSDYCDPSFVDPLGIKVIDVPMKGLPFNPLQPPPSGPSGVQPAETSPWVWRNLQRDEVTRSCGEVVGRSPCARAACSEKVSPKVAGFYSARAPTFGMLLKMDGKVR